MAMSAELLNKIVHEDDSDGRNGTALVIINILKELGIDRVTGDYNGSGDSPDRCDLAAWMKVDPPRITTHQSTGETVLIEDWVELSDIEKIKTLAEYEEAISEFIFNCSYDHWGGWYNNEGGHGTGTFHVKDEDPRFTIDFYQYIHEEQFDGEHTYDAKGMHQSNG